MTLSVGEQIKSLKSYCCNGRQLPFLRKDYAMTIKYFIHAITIAAIGTSLVAIVALAYHKPPEPLRLSQIDIERIETDLISRNADDCVIEKAEYGWKCTDKDGKVYKVKR